MTSAVYLVESGQLGAERVLLAGPEGRHAVAVRRLRPGESVRLVDGVGGVAECRVLSAGRAGLRCEVRRRYEVPAPQPGLTVVQALPRGDRGELAVQLLTEVGVDGVVPWAAARCVARWRSERGAKAWQRWRATARESTKQSRRAWLPDVREPASTAEVVEAVAGADLAVVLHESAGPSIAALDPPTSGTVVVIVGPEGGLTDEELTALTTAGGRPVHLGPTVLRTSTAGVVAAAALLSRTARWGAGP